MFSANWNHDIDSKSRNQIELLDNEVIACFNEGNAQKLTSLFSDTLKKIAGNSIQDLMNQIHPIIDTKNYELLDEYLINNSQVGGTSTIFKGMSEDNDYKINYSILTKETYISLIIYKRQNREFLFTCIYGKYGNTWELNTIRFGPYKIFEKNSIDFYKQSKIDFANGDLIDAGININLAQQTSLPANNAFVYFKLSEMMEFNRKLAGEAKMKIAFPLKINALNTSPQIFGVEPIVTTEGVFPLIKYLTTIQLADIVDLKAENDQIKKEIVKVFPGIDKNNKYVFLKAYNKIPDGKTAVPTYGFMLKKGGN